MSNDVELYCKLGLLNDVVKALQGWPREFVSEREGGPGALPAGELGHQDFRHAGFGAPELDVSRTLRGRRRPGVVYPTRGCGEVQSMIQDNHTRLRKYIADSEDMWITVVDMARDTNIPPREVLAILNTIGIYPSTVYYFRKDILNGLTAINLSPKRSF